MKLCASITSQDMLGGASLCSRALARGRFAAKNEDVGQTRRLIYYPQQAWKFPFRGDWKKRSGTPCPPPPKVARLRSPRFFPAVDQRSGPVCKKDRPLQTVPFYTRAAGSHGLVMVCACRVKACNSLGGTTFAERVGQNCECAWLLLGRWLESCSLYQAWFSTY